MLNITASYCTDYNSFAENSSTTPFLMYQPSLFWNEYKKKVKDMFFFLQYLTMTTATTMNCYFCCLMVYKKLRPNIQHLKRNITSFMFPSKYI